MKTPNILIGIVATVTGLGLQVVALGFGPLMLVQPLLVTALPFASVFSAAMAHRRVDRVIVLGALTCVAGLSAFLLLARPDGGSDQLVGSADLVPLAVALGVLAIGGLLLSRFVAGSARVLGLALATGIFYGVTALALGVLVAAVKSILAAH